MRCSSCSQRVQGLGVYLLVQRPGGSLSNADSGFVAGPSFEPEGFQGSWFRAVRSTGFKCLAFLVWVGGNFETQHYTLKARLQGIGVSEWQGQGLQQTLVFGLLRSLMCKSRPLRDPGSNKPAKI